MAKTVRKAVIYEEDLAKSTGSGSATASRGTSTGGTQTLTKLGAGDAWFFNNLNNILFVDGVKYTTIAAAITAAASAKTIIIIPSTYAGADPGTIPDNVTLIDFRGQTSPLGTNAISINAQTASVRSRVRVSEEITAPDRSVEEVTIVEAVTGAMPDGHSIGALTATARTQGAITTPGTTDIAALEGDGQVSSTGGTINQCIGVHGHAESLASSTTNVTDMVSVNGIAPVKSGTGTITNAYGGQFEQGTAGSTLNKALRVKGNVLFSNANNIEALDSGGTARPIILQDANNILYLRAMASGHASGDVRFQSTASADWLIFKTPDVTIDPGGAGYALRVGAAGFRALNTGDIDVRRVKAGVGTALVAGDFALSAGWGNTASVGSLRGTDQFHEFTITSAGTGQGASPTVTLTYKDGTWTTAPIVRVNRQEFANQATVTFTVTTQSATQYVLTFNGTPVAAETYRICVFVGGI